MKKTLLYLTTGVMLLSLIGCSNYTLSAGTTPIIENEIVASNETTDDTTVETTALQEEGKEYVPSEDNGYVFPYVTTIDFSGPVVRKTSGLKDRNGTALCDPIYNEIKLIAPNIYRVSKFEGEDLKYGLLTLDGKKFTGIRYSALHTDEERSYLTRSENGKILITCLDKDLNVIFEDRELVLSDRAVDLLGDTGSCVVTDWWDKDRAVIATLNQYGLSSPQALIDTKTGEVLLQLTKFCRTRGDLIIKTVSVEFAQVFDIDGNDLYGTRYDTCINISKDRMLLLNEKELLILDIEGNELNKMSFDHEVEINGSNGMIIIDDGENTSVYDPDLNLIKELPGMRLKHGSFFCDPDPDEKIAPLYFKNNMLTNLDNGNTLDTSIEVSDRRNALEIRYGYLFDFILSGHDFKWTVYDQDLSVVMEGTGVANILKDKVTGKTYLSNYDPSADATSVYDLETGEILTTVNADIQNTGEITDGIFFGESTAVDVNEDRVIFSNKIENVR